MSAPGRVRSAIVADSEPPRSVLRPAGNNAPARKPTSKPSKKAAEKPQIESESRDKKVVVTPEQRLGTVRAMLRQQEMKKGPNSAMNGSWSSDASSSDSFYSRASSGRFAGKRVGGVGIRRKLSSSPKAESGDFVGKGVVDSGVVVESIDGLEGKKRCSWVTPNTDPSYVAFHDEEWGAPVHDDKKLFELLCLSGALAELTWPAILSKRRIFREVFLDFDPIAVSRLNEKKFIAQGSAAAACSLLSEPKLRAIIENARQISKIVEEFGSFDNYIWNFVNNKPVVSQFRYPRQVPVRTSKADFISKDLVRRGFRSVGPTVVYCFMQVAGLTNDHLISCFRFRECIAEKGSGVKADVIDEPRRQEQEDGAVLELLQEAMEDKLSLCS